VQHDTADRLAEAEARYRLLAENAAEFVTQTSPDGVIGWVSPSVESVLGYRPADLVGHTVQEFFEADPEGQPRIDLSAPRADQTQVIRGRASTADGRSLWIEQVTRRVVDPSGAAVAHVGGWRVIDDEVIARIAADEATGQLRATMEAMLDPMVLLEPQRDAAGTVVDFIHVDANAAALRHTNSTREQLIGTHLLDLVPGQEAAGLLDCYRRVIDVGEPMLLEGVPYQDEMQAGQPRLFDVSAVKAGDLLSLTFRDVTEGVRSAEALAASEALFRTVMQSAAIGMAVMDVDGTIQVSNPAFSALLQRDESWLLSHSVFDIVIPADVELVTHGADMLVAGTGASVIDELRLTRADGSIARTRVVAVKLPGIGDGGERFLVQVEDLTAEREANEQLAFHAFYDTLTGLRNRAWLLDALDEELTAASSVSKVAVFFIDLDNFKLINESLGHAAGDALLCAVAERISGVLSVTAQVGRFGGDEFVAVVPGIRDLNEVEQVAARISAAIATELEVAGHSIVPTASIGIAVARSDDTAASLLRDTNTALYRAKAAGRARWNFFDEEMHAQSMSRLTLEAELREGLARREFVAHYQPIVDLAQDFAVVGHEALVRWQHPTRGLLPPGAFLDVAEDSGLIVGIGHQVLDQVCALLAERPELPGAISVNVSAVQLRSRDWIEDFTGVMRAHEVDPRRLVVEVTETAVLSAVEAANTDLASLRALGVGVHVDDFGTGFSSISLLRDLPVTGLKLDRSFVNDLTDADSPANALASGLAGLVSGLNLIGIAEGIETEDQAATLLAQGWHLGQGYFFGRPAPMPDRAPSAATP
jgi:diguanylate cyclase (GGDEF)-like protein/PAS domain S-box-containing protein